MIRPIVQRGDPVLTQVARPVDDPGEWREVAADMVDTMRDAPGVGLAAPQIGLSVRLFVMEDVLADDERERAPLPLTVVANPVLEPIGEETATFDEGCLSAADHDHVPVRRWRRVRLRGTDLYGNPVDLDLTGWPARIAQHEVDHLDGILCLDRFADQQAQAQAEQQGQ